MELARLHRLKQKALVGLSVTQPSKIKDNNDSEFSARENAIKPDAIFIVVGYGRITPSGCSKLPRLGNIN